MPALSLEMSAFFLLTGVSTSSIVTAVRGWIRKHLSPFDFRGLLIVWHLDAWVKDIWVEKGFVTLKHGHHQHNTQVVLTIFTGDYPAMARWFSQYLFP